MYRWSDHTGELGLRIEATSEARRDSPRPLVKAATYHQLSFGREGDAWRATVVLDV